MSESPFLGKTDTERQQKEAMLPGAALQSTEESDVALDVRVERLAKAIEDEINRQLADWQISVDVADAATLKRYKKDYIISRAIAKKSASKKRNAADDLRGIFITTKDVIVKTGADEETFPEGNAAFIKESAREGVSSANELIKGWVLARLKEFREKEGIPEDGTLAGPESAGQPAESLMEAAVKEKVAVTLEAKRAELAAMSPKDRQRYVAERRKKKGGVANLLDMDDLFPGARFDGIRKQQVKSLVSEANRQLTEYAGSLNVADAEASDVVGSETPGADSDMELGNEGAVEAEERARLEKLLDDSGFIEAESGDVSPAEAETLRSRCLSELGNMPPGRPDVFEYLTQALAGAVKRNTVPSGNPVAGKPPAVSEPVPTPDQPNDAVSDVDTQYRDTLREAYLKADTAVSSVWMPEQGQKGGRNPESESGTAKKFLDMLEAMAAEMRQKIWEAKDEAAIDALIARIHGDVDDAAVKDDDFYLTQKHAAMRAGIRWADIPESTEKESLRNALKSEKHSLLDQAVARKNIIRLRLEEQIAEFSDRIAKAGYSETLDAIGKDIPVGERKVMTRVFLDIPDSADLVASGKGRVPTAVLKVVGGFIRESNRNLRRAWNDRMKELNPAPKETQKNGFDAVSDFDGLYGLLREQGTVKGRKEKGSDVEPEPLPAETAIGLIESERAHIARLKRLGAKIPKRFHDFLGTVSPKGLSDKIRELATAELDAVNRMNEAIEAEVRPLRESAEVASKEAESVRQEILEDVRALADEFLDVVEQDSSGVKRSGVEKDEAFEVLGTVLKEYLESRGVSEADQPWFIDTYVKEKEAVLASQGENK
jgi:hypothetical protein